MAVIHMIAVQCLEFDDICSLKAAEAQHAAVIVFRTVQVGICSLLQSSLCHPVFQHLNKHKSLVQLDRRSLALIHQRVMQICCPTGLPTISHRHL